MTRVFKSANYQQPMLLPPTIDEWLPKDHLARFIVTIIEQLDLSDIYSSYGLRGSTPYDPKMLLGLVFYGYCTGVFSSRKIERATFDSIAFRYISGDHHPDHDTINSFRKRFLPQIGELFKQILIIATEAGVMNYPAASYGVSTKSSQVSWSD